MSRAAQALWQAQRNILRCRLASLVPDRSDDRLEVSEFWNSLCLSHRKLKLLKKLHWCSLWLLALKITELGKFFSKLHLEECPMVYAWWLII